MNALQQDCNEKLKRKLEAVRKALEDEYRVQFRLVTTGTLTEAAQTDLGPFSERSENFDDFSASLQLVDAELLETRLSEAEAQELPSLDHVISVDANRTLVTELSGARTVMAILPLRECLRLPGITDGRLFRKNVRQSLGANNKVNKALRDTITASVSESFSFTIMGLPPFATPLSMIQRPGDFP